jgi:hypothetical protein
VKPRAPGNTSHHDSRLVVVGWWGRGYITCHVGTLFTESCEVLDAMQQVMSMYCTWACIQPRSLISSPDTLWHQTMVRIRRNTLHQLAAEDFIGLYNQPY